MKQTINFTRRSIAALAVLFTMIWCGAAAQAQTTAFTYQGRFTDSSVNQPTNGTYTMTFRLFDAPTNGNQIPNSTASITSMVSVVNNIFTTRLDFGAVAFNTTNARYLEIQVGSTVLIPRQEITSTPLAVHSLNAANADSLGGVAANQYVQTNDARLSDSRTPTAGSANYIQNGTTPQALTNFNISGNGVIGGKVGIGTTTAPTTASLQVNGSVLARGGAPGADNGYAFSGNGGDDDSGMFSTADGTLQFYANSRERIRLTRSLALTGDNGANGSSTGSSNPGGAGAGINLQSGNGGAGGAGGGFELSSGGGAGAGITIIAGNGGTGGSSGNGGTGGAGAGITLQSGSGGNGGGATTEIRLQGGNGGDGSVNFNGGNGANISLQAGSGGRGVNFRNGGNGASITLQPGIGGTAGSSSVSGTNGNIILAPTSGNVGIGTTNPTSKLYVNGDLTVTGTLNGTVSNATNADKLGNVDASQFVQTTNTTTFIRNQTTPQTGNFNITGSGTVGGLNITSNSIIAGNLNVMGSGAIGTNLSVTGNVTTNSGLFAVGGGENLRVVRGIFQVSGGIVTITGGSGFTVTRNSVGNYSVNFTTAFSGPPTVIPSVISGATIIGTSSLGAAGTTITAYSPNGNPGDPSYVMFIAAGPK